MKTLFKLIVGLLLLVAVLLTGIYFFAGYFVKTSVEKIVPNITKTTVAIDSVVIAPTASVFEFGLKGFKLGNPTGFQQPTSVELGKVEFILDLDSVLKSVKGSNDAIVINKISVIAPKITYEIKSGTLTDSNIAAIQKNVQTALGITEKKPEEKKPETTEEGPEKKFIVKEFTFAESTVTIAYGANPVTIPLPSFSLKDLGVAEGGLTGKQLGLKITSEVTKQIIGGAADATTKAIKDIGKAAGEGLKDVGKNLQDAGKNAGDTIKGLFK